MFSWGLCSMLWGFRPTFWTLGTPRPMPQNFETLVYRATNTLRFLVILSLTVASSSGFLIVLKRVVSHTYFSLKFTIGFQVSLVQGNLKVWLYWLLGTKWAFCYYYPFTKYRWWILLRFVYIMKENRGCLVFSILS